jgi:hypothetical protein
LGQCGIDYDCVDVDRLEADSRRTILEEIKKVNPQWTFPTLVAGEINYFFLVSPLPWASGFLGAGP